MAITNRFLEPAIGGRRDEILHYHIDFDQDYDRRTGKPVGRPVLNQLTVSITRDSEEDAPFYVQWQLEPASQQNLDICFYEDNQLKRSIKIKEAFLTGYTQSSNEPGTIEETLVLSPKSVEVDGAEFTREAYM